MTRGIHLKQLTQTDLGHLGLPLEALEEAVSEAVDASAQADPGEIDQQPRIAAVVCEVRTAVEDALGLLTEALSAQR